MSEEIKKYIVDGKTFETQEEYREYLALSDKYRCAYEPWTAELDKELKELMDSKSISELALYFKRRTGAIRSRLLKLNLIKKSSKLKSSKIVKAIIEGSNPRTGEKFDEDSIWSHQKNKVKNKTDIRKDIKYSLKQDFKFDLVLIQIGFMFEAIEEDAIFLCDSFDCQLQGVGKLVPYEITGFPVSVLEKKKQHLDSMNIECCIVEQMKDSYKGRKQRVVTFSTIDDANGLMF